MTSTDSPTQSTSNHWRDVQVSLLTAVMTSVLTLGGAVHLQRLSGESAMQAKAIELSYPARRDAYMTFLPAIKAAYHASLNADDATMGTNLNKVISAFNSISFLLNEREARDLRTRIFRFSGHCEMWRDQTRKNKQPFGKRRTDTLPSYMAFEDWFQYKLPSVLRLPLI